MATVDIQARLLQLEDISLSIRNPKQSSESIISAEDYTVDVGGHLEVSTDSTDEISIRIVLIFDLRANIDIAANPVNDSSDKHPSLHYEGAVTYLVKGEGLKPEPQSKNIRIPTQLVHRLGEIAYSTFRGVIYSKADSNILKKVPIPLLDDKHLARLLSPKKVSSEEQVK